MFGWVDHEYVHFLKLFYGQVHCYSSSIFLAYMPKHSVFRRRTARGGELLTNPSAGLDSNSQSKSIPLHAQLYFFTAMSGSGFWSSQASFVCSSLYLFIYFSVRGSLGNSPHGQIWTFFYYILMKSWRRLYWTVVCTVCSALLFSVLMMWLEHCRYWHLLSDKELNWLSCPFS